MAFKLSVLTLPFRRLFRLQLSITQKVMLGFLLLVLCLLGGSLTTLFSGYQIRSQIDNMTGRTTPLVLQTSKISVVLLNADRQLRSVPGSQDSHPAITTMNNFTDLQGDFDQALTELKRLAQGSEDLLSLIDPLNTLDTDYFDQGKELGKQQLALLDTRDKIKAIRSQWRAQLSQLQAKEGADSAALDSLDKATLALLDASDSFELSKLAGDQQQALASVNDDPLKASSQQLAQLKGRQLELADAVQQLAEQTVSTIDYATAVLGTVDQTAHDRMGQGAEHIGQALTLSRWLSLGSLGISLLLAAVVAVSIYRSIKKPLAELLAVQHAAVQGDMTREVGYRSHNEFGLLSSSTNQLLGHIRQLLEEISQGAGRLTSVVETNREQSTATHQALNQQRQQTQQVNVAMGEMEKAVQEVAQSAAQTLTRIQDMAKAVASGQQRMSANIDATQALADKLESSGKAIDEVEDYSMRIGGVLDVIQGVAEQTNLLALNAAIEAARAGEHGRGFAVVASEVRNLAQQTAESAKTIHQMIDNLQRSTQGAVKLVAECRQEMDRGLEQSAKAADAMGEVQGMLREVSGNSEQIATAAAQQQATTEDIARSLVQIAEITEHNHQGVSAFTESSRQMESLVQAQDQLLRRFQR
ncbi:methyl-accepting chemotaxis protein [Gallaecimonas kandeliae]|uniref:methyl-accepting chemotaxis protein n=1 Tax=Gallaecimonas kandeliae TaxID=3029055 RepID=UPI0026492FCC|nr:methyl-accepting chemotaxis protein [Gallaecimonas kandeliae]WKE64728.1 methyl-accepting chemotaxis protein [Gallaecimonas kandeliae]